MSSEIQYPYAFDESDNLVFIKEVRNEQRYVHSYHCPECHGRMRPRLGKHNEWHFYHSENQKCGIENYIHKTAKSLLINRFNDRTHPLYISLSPSRPCKFSDTCKEDQFNCWIKPEPQKYNLTAHYDLPAETEVDVEDTDGHKHFRPDVLLRSTDPKRKDIFIEVFYKHKSTSDKIESGRRIIEIRIRNIKDLESLRTIDILKESNDIKFYNFTVPSYPEQIASFLVEYSRECGTELPPDGLPSCLNTPSNVYKYIKCPLCGGKLIFRNGRLGRFYGCSNYPSCRYTTKQ